jgi:hypothetical protein
MNTHSPNMPKESNKAHHKVDDTVVWDKREVVIVEFMQQGYIITSEVYVETSI